jgi:hypothetical protein
MEAQLINALMKLFAKAGGGSLIKDLIQEVDENRNPKIWTPAEIEKAIQYVRWQTENFGTAEAAVLVETLIRKYNLDPELFHDRPIMRDASGVSGLQ